MPSAYLIATRIETEPRPAPIVASVHGHAQAVVIVKDHAIGLGGSLAGAAAQVGVPRPQPGRVPPGTAILQAA